MSEPFIAEIRVFAFELDYARKGWAACNGQRLPIEQNRALFAIIGAAYGGDGTTDFALPDIQASAVMGAGTGPGRSPRARGDIGGRSEVTLTSSEMPAHSHTQGASQGDGTSRSPAGQRFAVNRGGVNMYGPPADGVPLVQLAFDTSPPFGEGQPHNNMQPYLPFNFAIALQGIIPARPD